jgi:hypothetical protein
MYQCNGHKMNEGINLFYSILRKTKLLIFLIELKVAVVQGISSGEWCLRSWVRSHPVLALYFFSSSISRENSGSVNKFRSEACIYPALIRKIFSRLGPLSSGVIMCMYRNFTVRLVTVWGSSGSLFLPSAARHCFRGCSSCGCCSLEAAA